MLALSRVGVLIEVRAIEVNEAMRIIGKVARDPIDEHSQTRLVTFVDQIFQIIRLAVAAGRGE
jgi:hypothetical protein